MLSNDLVLILVIASLASLAGSLFAVFSLRRNYVSRPEFDNLTNNIKTFEVKIEGIFQRTFDKIEERDAALSSKIEIVAQAACNGRRQIHERVGNLRDRVVKTETKLDANLHVPVCHEKPNPNRS